MCSLARPGRTAGTAALGARVGPPPTTCLRPTSPPLFPPAHRGPAGTSCSTWTGVRLADVLRACGVKSMEQGARHVCFRGPKGALRSATLRCALRRGRGGAGRLPLPYRAPLTKKPKQHSDLRAEQQHPPPHRLLALHSLPMMRRRAAQGRRRLLRHLYHLGQSHGPRLRCHPGLQAKRAAAHPRPRRAAQVGGVGEAAGGGAQRGQATDAAAGPACPPRRLIIPGYIGGRMIKWLEEVSVTQVGGRCRGGGRCASGDAWAAAAARMATVDHAPQGPCAPLFSSHLLSPVPAHPQDESSNYYHYHDNRVLPSHVDEKLANDEGAWGAGARDGSARAAAASEGSRRTSPAPFPVDPHPPHQHPAGWWYHPDFIINDLNVQSAIGYPAHDEVVPLAAPGATYAVRGYAYCGATSAGPAALGLLAPAPPPASAAPHTRPEQPRTSSHPAGNGNKIIRCEVSLDDGQSWRLAQVTHSTPPTAYGKHWAVGVVEPGRAHR